MKQPLRLPIRCASSLRCAWGSPRIPRQSYMCCFSWRTKSFCSERLVQRLVSAALSLPDELRMSVPRSTASKKLGEKSHAHFEMDVHSRTAGLGERRRSATVGFAKLRTTERGCSHTDRATVLAFRRRATGNGSECGTGANPASTPVSAADICVNGSGANAFGSAAAHHYGSGGGSLHRARTRPHESALHAHARGRDLSAEFDRRSATRPRSQCRPLFSGPHGYGRNGRPQGLSEGGGQGHGNPPDGRIQQALQSAIPAHGLLLDGLRGPHRFQSRAL